MSKQTVASARTRQPKPPTSGSTKSPSKAQLVRKIKSDVGWIAGMLTTEDLGYMTKWFRAFGNIVADSPEFIDALVSYFEKEEHDIYLLRAKDGMLLHDIAELHRKYGRIDQRARDRRKKQCGL